MTWCCLGQKHKSHNLNSLLSFSHLGSPIPICLLPHVCNVQISATHVSTVWWHSSLELPFRAMVADRHALRANNPSMATEADFRRARCLEQKDFSRDTLYGMCTPEVGGVSMRLVDMN